GCLVLDTSSLGMWTLGSTTSDSLSFSSAWSIDGIPGVEQRDYGNPKACVREEISGEDRTLSAWALVQAPEDGAGHGWLLRVSVTSDGVTSPLSMACERRCLAARLPSSRAPEPAAEEITSPRP